jgi:hypothetical protein
MFVLGAIQVYHERIRKEEGHKIVLEFDLLELHGRR